MLVISQQGVRSTACGLALFPPQIVISSRQIDESISIADFSVRRRTRSSVTISTDLCPSSNSELRCFDFYFLIVLPTKKDVNMNMNMPMPKRNGNSNRYFVGQ